MTSKKFVPATLVELGRIRRYLGITPIEAAMYVPCPGDTIGTLETPEGENFMYAPYVKRVYGEFLLRRLLDKIASQPQDQPKPQAQPKPQEVKIPTMQELHVMRVYLGMRQEEAAVLLGWSRAYLSLMERGKMQTTLAERDAYHKLLVRCQKGEVKYKRVGTRIHRTAQEDYAPGEQILMKV